MSIPPTPPSSPRTPSPLPLARSPILRANGALTYRVRCFAPTRCDAAWAELAAPAKEAYVTAAAKTWRGTYRSSVDIFDFSERKCMKCAADVVTHIRGARRPQPLLVLPVGDALQEPFWPEGLGVNRGCHNALDACWAANKWAAARGDAAAEALLVEERQYLYQEFTLQMHGKNRAMLRGYRADNTRIQVPPPLVSLGDHARCM